MRRATSRPPAPTADRPHFYPRSPCGERREGNIFHVTAFQISIHALLAESDENNGVASLVSRLFLSTLSLRRATRLHLLRGRYRAISIHALLAESDRRALAVSAGQGISIHALLAESDKPIARHSGPLHDFYPRSPCGERPRLGVGLYLVTEISIHALLAESDIISIALLIPPTKFLSTLSLRRATRHKTAELIINVNFYPRSPCGERRSLRQLQFALCRNFYPRSPCGERRLNYFDFSRFWCDFYPRSPCGERQTARSLFSIPFAISIHALLAESD